MSSRIRPHRGARTVGGDSEPYLPPVPFTMPESGWDEWLHRMARTINSLIGQVKGVAVTGGSGGVIVSPTPPVFPSESDIWFDTIGGQTYLWFNDGTSSQWISISNCCCGV